MDKALGLMKGAIVGAWPHEATIDSTERDAVPAGLSALRWAITSFWDDDEVKVGTKEDKRAAKVQRRKQARQVEAHFHQG